MVQIISLFLPKVRNNAVGNCAFLTLLCVLQITSLFMHISPALVCWAWRWYPDPSVVKFDQMSAEQLKAYNTASWWDIGVLSMSSYMIWVVLYYIKVRALPVFSQGRVLLTDHLSGSSTMTSPVW